MLQLHIGSQLAVRIDPSDVLQDVYLDAARRLPAYLQDAKVSPYVWLRGLAWDRLAKLQRHHVGTECRAVQRETPLPEHSSAALAKQRFSAATGPSSALVRGELCDRVRQAIDLLNDRDREIER